MRKLMFVAVALMAVVGAGVAYSASSPSAKLQKQDRLWGGGYVAADSQSVNDPTFTTGVARNLAVDAHAEGNGSDAVGNSAQNNQTARTVTCLSVDGNKAAVGGVVLASSIGNPGDLYLQYFVDRGTSSPSALRDWTSALYTGSPTSQNSAWPPGFPYVCPPAGGSASDPPEFPAYLEMAGGDITVQDAPSN